MQVTTASQEADRKTGDVLDYVRDLRRQQRETGAETLTSTNDLIAGALAYIGRASEGVRRNSDDPKEMLLKGISLLVDAAERL